MQGGTSRLLPRAGEESRLTKTQVGASDGPQGMSDDYNRNRKHTRPELGEGLALSTVKG